MNRSKIIQKLDAAGIEYSKLSWTKNLEKLLPTEGTSGEIVAPVTVKAKKVVKNNTNDLLKVITDLAGSVTTVMQEMMEIKSRLVQIETSTTPMAQPQRADVTIGGMNLIPPTEAMFPRVPRDLEIVAQQVLGDKFQFECEALTDQPAFLFTVIVPEEYTKVRGEKDCRSKVIPSNLGANGVREWCERVKDNVIKTLGADITIK